LRAAPSKHYTLTVTAGDCCPVVVLTDTVPFTIAQGGQQTFPDLGSPVDLEAITVTCCEFVEWTVDSTDVITDNPTTINQFEDGNHTVVATCNERGPFALTVNKVGTGTVTLAPTQPPYDCCTWVTMTANNEGWWVFDHWSGDVDPALTTTNPISIHMDDPKVITATFVEVPQEYPLTVTSDDCYTISVTYDITTEVVAPDTTEVFDIPTAASTVTLETVGDCCSLTDWVLDTVSQGNDPTLIVPVDGPHTVVALSHGPPFTLTLDTAGRGRGTVEGAGVYTPCHTMATITATPGANSVFAGWSGDWVSPDAVVTDVDMNMDRTVIATFNLVTYTVAVSESVPPDGGEVEIEEEWPDPEDEYEYGETITVTAVPSYCYEFVGWGGDWDGITDTQVIITVTGDLEIFAIFRLQTHNLDVNVVGEGEVTLDPPGGVYSCCTWVTMTAVPTNTEWTFVGWSGDLVTTTNPATIHIGEEDLVVTATFAAKTYTMTITDPDGGVIEPDPEQPAGGYDYGTVVTLTAKADHCYEFVEWGGDLAGQTDNPIVITVTAEMTITAVFELQEHTLTVIVDPSEGGTVDPPGGVYTCGTDVTLTATPTDANWEFVEWSDGETATQTVVHMDEEDVTITATFYFSPTGYILTVNTVGNGSVTKNPDQATYDPGDVVTLTAVADTGWVFYEWSGDLTGSDNPDTVTMTSDKEVTATFTTGPDEYVLTVTSDGCCSILVEYGAITATVAADDTELFTITAGIGVTLTATPGELCGFDGWTVDGGSVTMDNSITVTMDDNHIAVATCTRHFIFLPLVARNYSSP
jgi:uncharacterized repeat protein (TIGR02543 family)